MPANVSTPWLRASSHATVPRLRVALLGGFRVERLDIAQPISGWHRRTAKTVTKLLAVYPGHALHREQILDILWPEADPDSALNSFGKAVHAARRAFEPELLPREGSAYLSLTDAMLALNTEHVEIDADRFQELAESALARRDIAAYELALKAYGGELLPEDRYEDWCTERRGFLAELRVRLLLGLADLLAQCGAHRESADRLREVLQHDPTREDVHRRVMRLYAEMGSRDQAVRQFHVCQGVLRRELDLAPDKETLALFQDVVANLVPKRSTTTPGQDRGPDRSPGPVTADHSVETPFVGRDAALSDLCMQLAGADAGTGRMILVSGEAGVGKTRLVAEFATEAKRCGAAVLWGGGGAHANHLAYGSFSMALEGYAASRPSAERDELARRYPPLAHFVPSLGCNQQVPPLADRPGDEAIYLLPAIVRLLTDLTRERSVVLVLGDLHDAHPASLELAHYLAHLARRRRWLMIGAFRDEEAETRTELRQLLEAMVRDRLCHRVELERLDRSQSDELVRALLRSPRVSPALLEHVYALSLGNPLFVEQLLLEMQERGELVRANGYRHLSSSPAPPVPARVRALVSLNLGRMEDSARRVLALAAAADQTEVSLADLRAGAAALQPPVSDVTLFDALDRALESRILEERDDGYGFRHPLVRLALYEDLSKHRRDQLHAALGRSKVEIARRPRLAAAGRCQ